MWGGEAVRWELFIQSGQDGLSDKETFETRVCVDARV